MKKSSSTGGDYESSRNRLSPNFVKLLRCPATKSLLQFDRQKAKLVSETGHELYEINRNGIPLFSPLPETVESKRQQAHYDKVSQTYCENLSYPHTQEYNKYLDASLLEIVKTVPLGRMAEVCCGRGEAIALFWNYYEEAVGVDISEAMLNQGANQQSKGNVFLLQGDATNLPLQSNMFDTVVMLGGVHHVNDRKALFSEVKRILKPQGKLIFREPVNDFFLWRWLRSVIYRLSPALDFETEHPLQYRETKQQLSDAGLELDSWQTYGFLGFCLLMNSDVLVVNRLLRFIPGIRFIANGFVFLDVAMLKIAALRRCGLQVVAVTKKPDINK